MTELTGTKGGSGVWQRIVSEMPSHEVYIEPFWGRGTLARKKRPARWTVGLDLDPDAEQSAAGVADLFFRAEALDWLEDYFRLRMATAPGNGRGPRAGTTPREAATPPGEAFHHRPPSPAASAEIAGNGGGRPSPDPAAPAGACTFGGAPWAQHFVYLDPPYLAVPNYYRHPFTPDAHRRLCRLFLRLPCPAALSGYRSEMYAEELRGVRSITIPTVNRAGRAVEEILWCNFPPPRRYHDVRHAGADRRERERIARRVRNWSSGLAAMTPIERQAVFDACAARFRDADRAAENGGATR